MLSPGSSSVTLEEIRHRVSESQIAHFYLGVTEIPCVINSPVRKDTKPSLGIYADKDGYVRFKDFSTGENGSIYDLLSTMWSCSYHHEVLERIQKDLGHFSAGASISRMTGTGGEATSESIIDIQVKVREWRDYDIEYWNSYGISKKMLRIAEVYPISHKMVYKNGQKYLFGAAKHAYAFVERKDGKVTYKIYQPFSKDFKWSSNIDRSVWSLWTKIPESGNTLIISSSLKDCLNLWCNLKIPAICMQGEGYLPKPQVMQELKSRFKRIIVFYDNDWKNPDNPGRTDSINICRMYGLQRVEIPEQYEAKDPSDLYLKYGKEKYMEIMRTIFKNREHYEQEDSQY